MANIATEKNGRKVKMMKKFIEWLNNVSIQRKFIPVQWFIIISVIFVSLFSFFSVATLNKSTENIIDINVRHKEKLSAIIRNMYVCRVLGRDILLQEDVDVRNDLYEQYIVAFNDLDNKMDDYSKILSGTQLVEFNRIIEEKNKYKDSMILSADIRMAGGAYEDALYALQVVTPIANAFFGSIDDFSNEEERLLNIILKSNDNLVFAIFVSGISISIFVIALVVMFIRFFSKNISKSLVKLERAMAEIAETGNMKIKIPNELYTKDEVGSIATVSNKMKTMLLEYSFHETLTGGLNTKAYHEELNLMFEEDSDQKDIWCVIADMNNLKLINDNLGHMEGDNAIRNSYHSVSENFRQYGKTFRIGGDEFVSILSGCTQEEVENAISTITMQIERLNIKNENKFSLAFGFGQFKGYTLYEYNEFFKTVDKKMYENKVASKQARLNARVPNPLEKESLANK